MIIIDCKTPQYGTLGLLIHRRVPSRLVFPLPLALCGPSAQLSSRLCRPIVVWCGTRFISWAAQTLRMEIRRWRRRPMNERLNE